MAEIGGDRKFDVGAGIRVDRRARQNEVADFLRACFGGDLWEFELPAGSGHETYIARSGARACFVKLGAEIERAAAMAAAGLSPAVLASGRVAGDTTILVQPLLDARAPSRADLQARLQRVAAMTGLMHRDPAVRSTLEAPIATGYNSAGLLMLENVRRRWEAVRSLVPAVVTFVDGSLDRLAREIAAFEGTGLVAAHRDFCNPNWLLTRDDLLYIVDLEAMAWDDPAADLGPFLWWYYPPGQRAWFLAAAGYDADPSLPRRMRVRTALHLLHITLPREGSFGKFDPGSYPDTLVDFRAAVAGEENPQGY